MIDSLNEKEKLLFLDAIAAIIASLATIALVFSGLLESNGTIREIMFILTLPAIIISVLLPGGDSVDSGYILALFIEFSLIWWIVIRVVRKTITDKKRSLD